VDPSRKRKIRLVVALSTAVLLAAGLVYTSFSASTEARQPSQLSESGTGTYELTGKVVPGSIERSGNDLRFQIADRDGSHPIPVTYSGTVPDPFRDGREVILTGKLEDGTFVGERDSLITKCPSKFTSEPQGQSS
jgi:cytochrome c-type biogenesis protein CcmE